MIEYRLAASLRIRGFGRPRRIGGHGLVGWADDGDAVSAAIGQILFADSADIVSADVDEPSSVLVELLVGDAREEEAHSSSRRRRRRVHFLEHGKFGFLDGLVGELGAQRPVDGAVERVDGVKRFRIAVRVEGEEAGRRRRGASAVGTALFADLRMEELGGHHRGQDAQRRVVRRQERHAGHHFGSEVDRNGQDVVRAASAGLKVGLRLPDAIGRARIRRAGHALQQAVQLRHGGGSRLAGGIDGAAHGVRAQQLSGDAAQSVQKRLVLARLGQLLDAFDVGHAAVVLLDERRRRQRRSGRRHGVLVAHVGDAVDQTADQVAQQRLKPVGVVQDQPVEDRVPQLEHVRQVAVEAVRREHQSLLVAEHRVESLVEVQADRQAARSQRHLLVQLAVVHVSGPHLGGHQAKQGQVRLQVVAEMGRAEEAAKVRHAVGGLDADLQRDAAGHALLVQLQRRQTLADVAQLQARQARSVVAAVLQLGQLPALVDDGAALVVGQRRALALKLGLLLSRQFRLVVGVGRHDDHKPVRVLDEIAPHLVLQVGRIVGQVAPESVHFGVDVEGLDQIAAVVPQRRGVHDDAQAEARRLVLDGQLDAVEHGLDALGAEAFASHLLERRRDDVQHGLHRVSVDALQADGETRVFGVAVVATDRRKAHADVGLKQILVEGRVRPFDQQLRQNLQHKVFVEIANVAQQVADDGCALLVGIGSERIRPARDLRPPTFCPVRLVGHFLAKSDALKVLQVVVVDELEVVPKTQVAVSV